jgi:hypothetical protein
MSYSLPQNIFGAVTLAVLAISAETNSLTLALPERIGLA